jgi:murein DD-endopeptidase MepM/ murein hydrolase activator NlpD
MRCRFTGVLIVLSIQVFGQQSNPVNIFQKATEDGGFQYFAQNLDLAPYQLEIEFTELNNLQSDSPLPYYTIVYPGDPKSLFLLEPKAAGSTSFKSSYKLTLGDPNAAIDRDFAYTFPYEHNKKYMMIQGANGSYTHQGKYAWDFVMEEGTKVCASRKGMVVRIKEDSNIGGPDISFMKHANLITVLHDDGSYADYVHLRQHGAIVNLGDQVSAGQVIGYSGNTGWSTKSHLHFQVYKAIKFGIETIPVKFLLSTGTVTTLEEQVDYRAFHQQ